MITGSITLNGISDHDLIMILQEKEKENSLGFNPSTLQNQSVAQNSGQKYNNCILSWQNQIALKSVYTILHKIIHGHEKSP